MMFTAPMIRTPTRKVTLDELISALNKAFAFKEKKETKDIRMKKTIENLIGEPKEDIEARIEKIYSKIVKAHTIMFSQLLPEWNRKYIVDTLLPILHLSQRHKVIIDQKEMFSEIQIMIIEDDHYTKSSEIVQ